MPDEHARTLSARFARLETATVSDVLYLMGWPHQSLADTFRPVAPALRMAGPACCYRGTAAAPAGEAAAGPLSAFIVEETVPQGAVAIVAAETPSRGAIFGGLLARALMARGCAGIVIEGRLRDRLEIGSLGLAVYCCGVTPVGNSDWRYLAADVAVTLPGQSGEPVSIAPGDIVVGDDDGVVVVPHAIAAKVAEHSERTAAMEGEIARAIEGGMTRQAAFAMHPRFDHVLRVRDRAH